MDVTSHAPGTPSYTDLATSDLDATKAFYTELFGWSTEDMPMGDDGVYTMLRKDGKDVAGAYTMMPDMASAGVPPHWMTYFTVDDVDAAAEVIVEHGGTVVMGPMDVYDAGRQVVAQDPTGATFACWQPKDSIGAYRVNEPGAMVWVELQTNDTDACEAFYGKLFGWTAETTDMPGGPYTSFNLDGAPVAGMMAIQPEWGPVPPNWSIYLGVDDVDAVVDRAVALGGTKHTDPMDVPEAGRFALLADPQGAMFFVMSAPTDT